MKPQFEVMQALQSTKHSFYRPQRAFWTSFGVSELQYLLFQWITQIQYFPPP
jgi:hypothetical protein